MIYSFLYFRKSLTEAVQRQTGQSRTQQYQETDDGYGAGVLGGASGGEGVVDELEEVVVEGRVEGVE